MKSIKFFSQKFSEYVKKLNEISLLNKDLEVKINSKYNDTLKKIESLKVAKEKIELEKKQLDVQTKIRLDQIEVETNYKKSEVVELTKNLQNVYDNTFNSVEWLSNKYADFYFLLDKKRIVMPVHKIASKCSDAQIMFSLENKELRRKNIQLELEMAKYESIKISTDKLENRNQLKLDFNGKESNYRTFSTKEELEELFMKLKIEHDLYIKNTDEEFEQRNTKSILANQKLKKDYDDHVQRKNIELDLKSAEQNSTIQRLKVFYDDIFGSIDWLSTKYADFFFLVDQNNYVLPKRRNTATCSDAQKEFAKDNKKLRKRLIELELQLNHIQSLVPDVEEIIDTTKEDEYLDDIEVETADKINYLVDVQTQLTLKTKSEILQSALNKYVNRKMSKMAVGKDYERYIGHLYEEDGYKVEYHGIKRGIADLGIDLICTKGLKTILIQCKNWSKTKNIHENAINQLFGTSMKYYLDKYEDFKKADKGSLFEDVGIPFNKDLQPIFITTTDLSDRAMEFASALKIEVIKIPYEKNYPRIKCNIGKDEYGKEIKIYHLPFDQKYDVVQNIRNGGVNVLTIDDAEKLHYRKAFRWRGE
ncbi:MAG: restriction endonuclease [Chitinophagales bacterium]|nr:restriction endonuclease [Chitinophagales bacterium]